MGLQPLDLQTMYSQLSNVAQQASGVEHSLQAAQNAQQKDIVRQNEELKHKVHETDKNASSSSVNQNGHNSGSASAGSGDKKQKESSDENENNKYRR